MAADGLYPLFTTQFSTILELKLQQLGSMLRGKVREGAHVGKMASPLQQVGAVTMKSPTGRYAPLARTDAEFTRRWVFPQDKEGAILIDTFDELKTIVDPKSQYAQDFAAAVGRSWDDAIITSAFATAQIGQDANGLSGEQFDPNGTFTILDTFGTSGTTSVGLTVAKLIEARRILRHYHNDIQADQMTLVIGSQQESELLNQVQVVSTEFNDRPVLTDGQLTRFLGFNIVVSERLATEVAVSSSATCRDVIVFVKSGLYLGVWKDMTNRISIRDGLSGQPYQLYTQTSFGATRTQPGKVLKILCKDSTGADITP